MYLSSLTMIEERSAHPEQEPDAARPSVRATGDPAALTGRPDDVDAPDGGPRIGEGSVPGPDGRVGARHPGMVR